MCTAMASLEQRVGSTGPELADRDTAVSDEKGFFDFNEDNGNSVSGQRQRSGSSGVDIAPLTLNPREFKLLDNVQLLIATDQPTVEVTYKLEEVATEQLKIEEKTTGLGHHSML